MQSAVTIATPRLLTYILELTDAHQLLLSSAHLSLYIYIMMCSVVSPYDYVLERTCKSFANVMCVCA